MSVLIAGYPYVRENYLKVFGHYNGKTIFILPEKWKAKGGKVVFSPPKQKNIIKTKAFFFHSNYPLIGGLLKGWMPMFLWHLFSNRKNVDLVYSATEPVLLSTLYQGFSAKILGKKHIIFTWENIPYDKKFRGINGVVKKMILWMNFRFCDGLVCGNHKALEIHKHYGKPMAVIPLSGVDEEKFKPIRGQKSFNGIDLENKTVFLFAGALDYRKGVHLLLDAFDKTADILHNVHLLVIGSGTHEKEFREIIEKSKHKDQITVLPWLSNEELPKVFGVSDVFLYPSISHGGWEEQFGYSMAEASLCELPVIATRSGSIDELVQDGKTGILVGENNVEELKEAMLELAQNSEKQSQMGKAGREYIISKFSHRVVADKFRLFFIKIIGSHKLVYIFNGRLPTEKAHGIQVTKMCEAFDSIVPTELLLPFRYNAIKENMFSFYGIKNKFAVKKLWSIDPLVIDGFPERVAFYIQSISSVFSVLVYILFRNYKNAIFYARDYTTLFFLCLFRFEPVAEIHDYRSKRARWFMRFILANSKKVILNSTGTKEQLLQHYEISNDKILVAPNGVDLDAFDINETKNEARKKLSLPQDKFIIGYTGRMESVGQDKGVECLLRAFAMLDRQDIQLCIVGSSSLAKQYGASNITFTGQVKHELVPLYLRAMDLVVIPLPKNQHALTTSPMKLFEFLAAGKTIISSDLPSLREYLNENNAVFFEPDDYKELADKIEQVVGDLDLTFRLSSQAKIDSRQYSWQNRAQKIMNFINV